MTQVTQKLEKLTTVVEELESNDGAVIEVSSQGGQLIDAEQGDIDLSLSVPLFDETAIPEGICLEAKKSNVADGNIQIEIEARFSSQRVEAESSVEQPTEFDHPYPHRDPDALQTVYKSCDTFEEMTEALGVDVTSETVRQQMIKHGIHEVSEDKEAKDQNQESPKSSDDNSDVPETVTTEAPQRQVDDDSSNGTKPPETEAVLPDGGLPEGLTLQEIKQTVQSKKTLYQAQKQLGTDRDQTRRLLDNLNLLDLVVGRLSEKDRREISEDELDQRINSAAPS